TRRPLRCDSHPVTRSGARCRTKLTGNSGSYGDHYLVERQMHIASTARLCLLIATPSGAIAQDSAAISRLSSGGGAPMVWFALALLLFLLGALAYSLRLKQQLRHQARKLKQTEERLN